MRYRPLNKAWSVVLAALAISLTLMFPGSIWGQVGAEVVNFFGGNSTFFGEPVPVGTTIAAFDPDGVQCGEFVVDVPGQYGLLPCRGDDSTTDEDEGAEPGDQIFFTMGGLPADATPISLNNDPVSPDTTITWTSNGDLWEVDLAVADGDGDSIPNGVECPSVVNPAANPQACPDTDGDGTPDFQDTDLPPPRPVGGYGEPLSATTLLAPWLVLAIALLAAIARFFLTTPAVRARSIPRPHQPHDA